MLRLSRSKPAILPRPLAHTRHISTAIALPLWRVQSEVYEDLARSFAPVWYSVRSSTSEQIRLTLQLFVAADSHLQNWHMPRAAAVLLVATCDSAPPARSCRQCLLVYEWHGAAEPGTADS